MLSEVDFLSISGIILLIRLKNVCLCRGVLRGAQGCIGVYRVV